MNIGELRQWLNEDRIDDPEKMVEDWMILRMLGLPWEKERKRENEIKKEIKDHIYSKLLKK